MCALSPEKAAERTRPRQLALDLPHRETLGREDFLVSACNSQAVGIIDDWPNWPDRQLVLIGPEGSGKTHLAEVWRARSRAAGLAADSLTTQTVPDLAERPALVVEDCDVGTDATALFHLLNEMTHRRAFLLLTASTRPSAWDVGLVDLASRLNRIPVATLEAPDDRLLEAVLVKQFADRQLEIDASVVQYLSRRLERTFAAVRRAVIRLDRMAIEEQRRVTRALAARMLSEWGADE